MIYVKCKIHHSAIQKNMKRTHIAHTISIKCDFNYIKFERTYLNLEFPLNKLFASSSSLIFSISINVFSFDIEDNPIFFDTR